MTELNRYHILFIEDNIGKKSAKKIAQHLGVDKKAVEEHIKRSKASPAAAPDSWKITAIQVAAVFAIALLARLVYLQQLSHTYFFAPFKGGFDDYIFDNWALEILKGNWLGDPSIFIYRMPLYVYFLSFIYFIFGHSYWAVYIVNALLGSAACLLVYWTGRMLFNRNAGFIAALIAALYGPFLFFGGMVVGETLATFLTCLAFLFLLIFQRTEHLVHAFLGGISIGLTMLLRGNVLVALPFILAWAFIYFNKQVPLKRFLYAIVIAAGVAFAVSPIIARNYIYTKDLVPIAASGGLNLYIGNAYGADGKYRSVERVGGNAEQMLKNSVMIAEKIAGRTLKPSEVSRYWASETFASIRLHGIAPLIGLMGKKFFMFWNAYEFPDIWDYQFFREYMPILRMPLVGMLLILPFAAAGLYLSWSRRGKLSLLLIFIAAYLISLMAFFISSRYRLGVVPFLGILAGYAATELWRIAREDRKKLAISAVIIIATAVFVSLPVERLSFETSYNSLGIMLKRDDKIEEAIKAYNKAIEIAPAYPTPYYNLGILYRDSGDRVAAASSFAKAVELAPDFAAARREMERLGGGDEE
jgi:4-amino-4-deoxy-L-arabinose transferase-like glycosyltransferase